MSDRTSLLDESWSSGRNNFGSARSRNSVRSLGDIRWDNSRTMLENMASRDVSSRALGLIDQANKYFKMKDDIERTIKAMDAKRVAESIRDQLAADQRVTLIINEKTGSMTLLRAGEGYLHDPKDQPFIFSIKGDDHGICRGDEIQDTIQFEVINRAGKKEWLLLDSEKWRREEQRRDKSDDNSRADRDWDRADSRRWERTEQDDGQLP